MSATPHVSPDPVGDRRRHGSAAALARPDPAAMDLSERPFVLVWEMTRACELACRHCRADAWNWHHPDELTTQEGKALLKEARRFGPGQLVVLSGGDPLARDDAEELVRYGTRLGLRMTMTPSGTSRLTRERLRSLQDAGLQRVALSIDGATPGTHDAFRGVGGSFRLTTRAARWAGELGIPLQVNTTVTRDTVDELPAVRDLVEELGAVLWAVFFLVPVGRGARLEPVSPDRAETVAAWLVDVTRTSPFGVKTTEAPLLRRVALQRQHRDALATSDADGIGRRAGVTAGRGFAFVSHTGELQPSGFLDLSAGNVRERGLVDLYRESSLFRNLREPDGFGGKCGVCEFRRVCGGSRSRAFAYTGDPLASDPLCAYVPHGYEGPLPEQRVA